MYKGSKSVEWLLSHRYPFLICIVDKKSNQIEIYQTLIITTCFFKKGINSITISTDAWNKPFKNLEPESELKLCIGPPILKFKITKLENPNWLIKVHKILKGWIELDQDNINQKTMGLNFFRVPERYYTNKIFDKAKSFIGNFKLESVHQYNFYDVLFRLLSQLVHQIAAEKNLQKFKIIANFTGQFTSNSSLKDSWGIKLLALAVNTGSKHLNLSNRITLTKSNGTKETPIADIENATSKKTDQTSA